MGSVEAYGATREQKIEPERASASGDDPIDALLREACTDPSVISFAGGFPATETIPQGALAEAAVAAVRSLPRVEASLQYCWPEGKPALRAWVAQRLAQRGVTISADEVIITAGAQQALSLTCQALLQAGQRVLVDPVCYPGALDVLRKLGGALTDRPSEAEVAYVMPGVSNPTGKDTLRSHWEALKAASAPLIVDEAYAELRFDGALPPPLIGAARERVFHIGTVSKTLCPGLRIGWLVPPPAQLQHFLSDKTMADLQAGTLAQTLLVGLLKRVDYGEHLRDVRALYCERAAAMVGALRRRMPHASFYAPEGGFSLFVDMGRAIPELSFFQGCVREGVVYDPGSRFLAFPERQKSLVLRLCFSSLDESLIEQGIERLARVRL